MCHRFSDTLQIRKTQMTTFGLSRFFHRLVFRIFVRIMDFYLEKLRFRKIFFGRIFTVLLFRILYWRPSGLITSVRRTTWAFMAFGMLWIVMYMFLTFTREESGFVYSCFRLAIIDISLSMSRLSLDGSWLVRRLSAVIWIFSIQKMQAKTKLTM